MIVTKTDIKNLEQTITRPTIVGLLHDLSFIFNISPHIRLDIENENNQLAKLESYMTSPIDYRYGHTQETYIETSYIEEIDEDRVMSNQLDKNGFKPILRDDMIGVCIKPIYYFTNLNLNIKYKTKSQNEIHKFINNLKYTFMKNRETYYHKVIHHIHIPTVLTTFIGVVHDIKVAKGINSDTFTEYVFGMSDDNLTLSSNQKQDVNLAYKDIQEHTVGYFTTDVSTLKHEYDKDTGYYSVDLTYKLSYNKPVYLNISYPELICNTVLPNKYLIYKDYNIEDSLVIVDDYLQIPSFDNYRLHSIKPHMVSIFSILVIPEDGYLCNLNELPNFTLDPLVKRCLEAGEYRYLLEPYESILHIEFYENDTLLDSKEWLTIDENLNINVIKDIDITKSYRLLILLVTDASYLSRDAINRTLACGMFNEVFKVINNGGTHMLKYDPIQSNLNKGTIHVNSILRVKGVQ